MTKVRAVFFCSACGNESPRWLGRCPACEAWNTVVEAPAASAQAKGSRAGRSPLAALAAPVRLGDVSSAHVARMPSGIGEFDTLLGGGIVPGSLVLLGGPPGAGKSTLLLQIAALLAAERGPVVYVCGEESAAQTKMRAGRLGASDDLLLFDDLPSALAGHQALVTQLHAGGLKSAPFLAAVARVLRLHLRLPLQRDLGHRDDRVGEGEAEDAE